MALVVFLKGINVGGHRTFRPSVLARQLARFGVVSVGATGTFVIRKPVSRTAIRAEITRRLPFTAEVIICDGSDISRLVLDDPLGGESSGRDVVPFVSILSRRRPPLPVPVKIPAEGAWGLKVLGCRDRFVFGIYRRQMKAIGYLGQLERLLGVPVTTRSWGTILSIARILNV